MPIAKLLKFLIVQLFPWPLRQRRHHLPSYLHPWNRMSGSRVHENWRQTTLPQSPTS